MGQIKTRAEVVLANPTRAISKGPEAIFFLTRVTRTSEFDLPEIFLEDGFYQKPDPRKVKNKNYNLTDSTQ